MSSSLPAKLKSPEIFRFVIRAAQLENIKPVITYWCNYWTVQLILDKFKGQVHSDEECLSYTTGLMDKLEKFKKENSDNDAVVDDLAGKAYVEEFALETLQRAENAMRYNRVTSQTTDTLQAAATFLELLRIWGEFDPETAAKIKFAKYHAVRISKAFKAGNDPNETNPVIDQQPTADPEAAGDVGEPSLELGDSDPRTRDLPVDGVHVEEAAVGSRDPDFRLASRSSVADDPNAPAAASGDIDKTERLSRDTLELPNVPANIAESVDADARKSLPAALGKGRGRDLLAASSDFGSPASSANSTSPFLATTAATFPDAGSQSAEPMDRDTRRHSLNANTPPQLPLPSEQPPTDLSSDKKERLPTSPLRHGVQAADTRSEAPDLPPSMFDSAAFDPTKPISSVPRPSVSSGSGLARRGDSPGLAASPAPGESAATATRPPRAQPDFPARASAPSAFPPAHLTQTSRDNQADDDYDDNTAVISDARKHAQWAVSALNFEDVATAIKELNIALGQLNGLPPSMRQ